jgi:heme ABC exporter ATP-binding subunit CcmA
MGPVIHLQDVVAVQGRFPVLAGASLVVEAGEMVHLRGPNGSGKTSLLRVLAGLVPVVEGSATVLGIDLRTDRGAVRRRVGLLGHANGLYGDLTVTENVRFWATTSGASSAEVTRALHELGLDGRLANVAVSRLSTGQKRRTAIAALLARRPELWLLDEPHAGLDADTRDLLDNVLRLAISSGATVVYASHELERSAALGSRIVGVDGGVLTDTVST